MNMLQKIKASVVAISFAAILAMPMVVGAQDGYQLPTDSYGLAQQTSIGDVVILILQFFLGFLAILAILIIVVAGIMYMTSGGDEGRVDSAKRMLIYAIVGLIVALLGWVIVTAVSTALEAGA